MSVLIYTHANCSAFTYTPLHMYTHLETAHPAAFAATLAALGLRGLDALLIKQRLHSSPHSGTHIYPCIQCFILHATSFESQAHLQDEDAHEADIAAARAHSGDAGIAALITTAWLELVDETPRPQSVVKNKYTNEVYVNDQQAVLSITQNAGPMAKAEGVVDIAGPMVLTDIALTLKVSGFSVRENYPARVTLEFHVPRETATVAMLGDCVEEGWVQWGGIKGKIAWATMVRAVGVRVGAVRIATDAQVKEWVRTAGAVENGIMGG